MEEEVIVPAEEAVVVAEEEAVVEMPALTEEAVEVVAEVRGEESVVLSGGSAAKMDDGLIISR